MEQLTAIAWSSDVDGPWVPVRKDDSTFKGDATAAGWNPKYRHFPE